MNHETRYIVRRMTCEGCKRVVENALKSVQGVIAAEADLEEATVRIESDDGVSFVDMKKALSDFDQYSIEDL